MKYCEYKKHIEIINRARCEIENNIKILEPEKKRWNILLYNRNKIVRKMYLDYITLIDMVEDAENMDL